ncbi:MAG TPA: DUF2510 domain-containing protein [Acidimicrobiia bacterium]|nr:DUF2510 domain-containing protein [Acidimicrobiia bacterium]
MADAAWLPDPTGRFQYRYWDGSQWSAAVSRQGSQETDLLSNQPPPPAATPPPPPVGAVAPAPPPWPGSTPGPPPPAWRRASSEPAEWSAGLRVGVLLSAAVLLVGSCLTWVKATAGPFTATGGGLSRDGRITIAIAIGVGLIFLLVRQKNVVVAVTIVGGVLAAGTSFYDIADIKNRASDLSSTTTVPVHVTIGVGLILCAIAGVALLIMGLVAGAEARRA